MTEIVNMISSVGFPIAMCLIIMYFWNNQYSKTMQELRETISRLTEVVADNTKALALLEQRLGDDNNDGEQ
nr:MAG TPA: YvrJ protein family protein [Caudoviricetes sp.]